MGKGVKECVKCIMCERCKRWLVFSEECGFSYMEAIRKEYQWGMSKLEIKIEGEREKRILI